MSNGLTLTSREETTPLVPIVDLAEYNISTSPDNVSDDVKQRLAAQLHKAFTGIGFVCLKNHGVDTDKLETLLTEAETFFKLNQDVKQKYARRSADENLGWSSFQRERLSHDRPHGLKESFDFETKPENVRHFPEVPGFRAAINDFSLSCFRLSHRVLTLMAIGLDLDPTTFTRHHNTLTADNGSTLRCLYYPPVTPDMEIKPNQIRCAEHSDYGSITLLFQDNIGGLELRTRGGDYVPAKPVPNTVLINIGDLMQRWTSDKLVSTKHRVVVPKGSKYCRDARMSVAYFVHSDDDCVVRSLDGEDKYPPVKTIDYSTVRFIDTYGT
ncbi:2-oxoglutarate-dependent dioxygenase htyE [Lamellibrachia satsuma]|nr:2-oxoglutarate-dependent dioxygenase htyE [Lamellibrachia satsuma]